MHGKTMKIDDQDGHSERNAGTPEDVRYYDGPERVLMIWKDIGDNTAESCSNARCHYRQEPSSCHGGELYRVEIHAVRRMSLKSCCPR